MRLLTGLKGLQSKSLGLVSLYYKIVHYKTIQVTGVKVVSVTISRLTVNRRSDKPCKVLKLISAFRDIPNDVLIVSKRSNMTQRRLGHSLFCNLDLVKAAFPPILYPCGHVLRDV